MAWHDGLADDEVVRQITAAGSIRRYATERGLNDKSVRKGLVTRGLRERVLTALGADVSSVLSDARELELTLKGTQGGQRPYAEVKGDKGVVVTRPAPKVGQPEEWVREAGLDPEEWEAYNIRLNTWDGMTSDKATGDNRIVTLYQVRADLKRKVRLDWLFPAVDVAQRPAPQPRYQDGEPQRIMFFPDQHAPYHDQGLHYLAMCHTVDFKPHRIVNLGDICDFPTISRHRDNPAYFASATDCVDGGIAIINDQRTAAPNALIDLIEGNHDARPRTELLTRAERMYELRPGMLPGDDIPPHPWSLQHLLSLGRFHVNFVGPELPGDNYFQGLLELTPDIAAIHGFLTGAGSEKATAERLGMSVVFGHIHTQVVRHVTKHKGREKSGELVAISPGTMRATRGGAGFAWQPNWQQGYLTALIWPDGEWSYDMCRFDGKSLIAGGKRYR